MRETVEKYEYDGAILELTELHGRIGTLESVVETLEAKRDVAQQRDDKIIVDLQDARRKDQHDINSWKEIALNYRKGRDKWLARSKQLEAERAALVTALERVRMYFIANDMTYWVDMGKRTENPLYAEITAALAAVSVDPAQAQANQE